MQLNLQKVTDRHILIMYMIASGQFTNTQIAEKLDCSREYVSQLQTSTLFKSELELIRAQIRAKLLTEATDKIFAEVNASLDKLINVRDDPNASKVLQTRAAVEILDRNPGTAKWHKGAQVPQPPQTLSDEQIDLLTQTFTMDPTAQLALAQARKVLDDAEAGYAGNANAEAEERARYTAAKSAAAKGAAENATENTSSGNTNAEGVEGHIFFDIPSSGDFSI